MKNSKNDSLENFIANRQNVGNYEALFEELANSRPLTMMVSDIDLSPKAKEGVISMMDSGPLAQMYADNVEGYMQQYFPVRKR